MTQAIQLAITSMSAHRSPRPTVRTRPANDRTPGTVVPLRLASSLRDAPADDIAAISHEMRNALGTIRNAARLLRAPASALTVENARVLIERQVTQMARHVEDLLGVTSDPAGKQATLQRSHVDLRTIVGHSVAAIAPDMERRAHEFVVELPVDAIWVHADAARLEQVFSNLLINAAKYTPDGGKIVLSLGRRDTRACINIRDSGIGIDAATLLRVFDRYAQADAAAPCSEGGCGIGLAIVRELVEKHGGSVHAASKGLGRGSEFTVLVPVLWAT